MCVIPVVNNDMHTLSVSLSQCDFLATACKFGNNYKKDQRRVVLNVTHEMETLSCSRDIQALNSRCLAF